MWRAAIYDPDFQRTAEGCKMVKHMRIHNLLPNQARKPSWVSMHSRILLYLSCGLTACVTQQINEQVASVQATSVSVLDGG